MQSFYYWDEPVWRAVPYGPNQEIICGKAINGELYVGGYVTFAGSDSTFLLAKYDGNNFYSLTPFYSSLGDVILDIEYYKGTLFAGGLFNIISKSISNLAIINGDYQMFDNQFTGVGSSCNITSLEVFNNELYIAGYFLKTDGYSGDCIMKWNGSEFSELGVGVNGRIEDMKVYNNELFVVGSFTEAGGIATNGIAKWDGFQWYPMNIDSFDVNFIHRLAFYHDSLYIGGAFKSINGDSSYHCIAKYNQSFKHHIEYTNINLFPNPTQSTLTIQLSEASKEPLTIQIKNTLGQTIKTFQLQAGNKELEIDVSSFSEGLYFVQCQSGERIIIKKFIKQ